jgi:hypothetical protein
MYSPTNVQTNTTSDMAISKDYGYPRLFHHQGLSHITSSPTVTSQPLQQQATNGSGYQYMNSTYSTSRERLFSGSNALHSKFMDTVRTPVLQRSSSLPSQNSPSPPYPGSNTNSAMQYATHHYGSIKPTSYPTNNSNSWYNTPSSVSVGSTSLYHPPQSLENLQEWSNGGYPSSEQGKHL